MDAVGFAHLLEVSKNDTGKISLRDLQEALGRRGLHELAGAVRSLAGYVTPGRLSFDETVPWF
ncbi:MAG TPA: hypothetical protein VFC25_12080 [Verrucomicrobiae bacterium]|nr:hypothetical protein [Verrucomicrobiae bacterium]